MITPTEKKPNLIDLVPSSPRTWTHE